MTVGIRLGNRRLNFFGYSNSMLKDRHSWFFCDNDPEVDALNKGRDEVLQNFGTFHLEPNLLKQNARIGQLFTVSKKICLLKEEEVKTGVLSDIERNGYCFTDGIGTISLELAILSAKAFRQEYASAFQVRLGGVKGMLMVDSTLQGRQVYLRDSQIKFSSPDLTLNVIRCSRWSQGFLNRQLINLLYSIGVPSDYFEQAQQKALNDFTPKKFKLLFNDFKKGQKDA